MSILAITPENVASLLPAILEIERVSFISPWSGDAFLQEVRNPASCFWSIFVEGGLAGYICFWIVDREIQLLNVAVHPAKRGRGLARCLLREMIRTGVSRGMKQVWLEVRPSNRGARSLYEKIGFEAVGRRRRYYRDTDEDAILMSLNLQAVQTDREGVEGGGNGRAQAHDRRELEDESDPQGVCRPGREGVPGNCSR
jgi:[ribosomal protein S18]-alanine N-acetyltransferase